MRRTHRRSLKLPMPNISAAKRRQIAALTIIMACSLLYSSFTKGAAASNFAGFSGNGVTGFAVAEPAACRSECFVIGQSACYGSFVARCLDKNKDGCLEWNKQVFCKGGCEDARCNAAVVETAVKGKCESWCSEYATKYYDWPTVCKSYTDCSGCAMC